MSIIGITPRPTAQIVTRRHPLAMSLYAMVFVMGLVFLFQWYGTGQRTEEVFPGVPWYIIELWKWEMLTGGGVALLAVLVRPRITPHWPDLADCLHMEGIAAIVAAFGVATYLVGVLDIEGLHKSGSAIAIFFPIVLGHVVRGVQALREARKLQALVSLLDTMNEDEAQDG